MTVSETLQRIFEERWCAEGFNTYEKKTLTNSSYETCLNSEIGDGDRGGMNPRDQP